MKRFWKKQLPALLLALIMTVSLVPAAMADGPCTGEGSNGEHQWSEWAITNPPTCSEEGTEARTCTLCGQPESRTVPPTGKHDYQFESTTATCGKEGIKTSKCTHCGDIKTEFDPATGNHKWVDNGAPNPAATCGTAGSQPKICSICGETKNEPIPATGNHSWGPWQTTTSPTCTKAGLQTATCKNCSETKTEPLNPVAHTDVSPKDGKCDYCGQTMSTYYTITFQTPQNGSTSQQVAANSSPAYLPTANATYTVSNVTYTFYGWTSSATSTPYIYTNQTPIYTSASQIRATGNVTYYAVYKTSGTTVTFQTLSASGGTTTYQTQTVQVNGYPYNPGTPPTVTFGGKTYTFYGWTTDYNYYSTWYLYSNQRIVTPYTQMVTSATPVTYYAVYTTQDSGSVTYTVAPNGTKAFKGADFNDYYQKMAGSRYTLQYVRFSVSNTTTYNNFGASVYRGSTALTASDLNRYDFYYQNSRYGSYDLDDLSLQALRNAAKGSLTIPFTAYGSGSSVNGTLTLTINENGADGKTIVYNVAPGKEEEFDRNDFNDVFRTVYTTETVSHVVFDRPDSSAFSYGTLYSDYGDSRYETKFSRSDLNSAYFYYNNGYATGRNDYYLNDLSFVADSAFKTTVKLTFTAYGTNTSHSVKGTVEIRSTESTEYTVSYKVAPGQSVSLKAADFLTFLRKSYKNANLDYVSFDRPSDTSVFTYGTLYSNYGGTNQVAFSRSDLSSYNFYYSAKDATGRYDYAMDTLSFVAGQNFKDSIKLTFTAYGDNYDEEAEGTLVIEANGTAVTSSTYVGSIRYATTTGTRVQINANDIARYYKKNTGAAMQYVTLTGVPSTGGLYYNYYNTSKYGTTTRAQLTAANAGGQLFYASPASTSQFALTELTYVPSGTNYCAAIPFTAYGKSGSVSGAILISVSGSTVSEVYGVTPKNTAVTFPASSISSAVVRATGATPASIQLLSLPSYTAGTVYVGAGTTTLANTTTAYAIFSGAQSLRFVPSSTYTGSVEIPYVALNSTGTAIASGTFSLGVLNSKKTFTDVTSSTWCYKYVAELSDAGVIDGYPNGSFKPDSTVTYGAALKLIMLAAGYPEQAPTSKNSVFSGYLAKARADGIITASNVNLTKPITRLQVAQIAAGAMKLDTSNLSSVSPFTDTTNASVQALNAAGIVEGYFSNGTSTFRPNNTLTRGQVSAIVWRMRNYGK